LALSLVSQGRDRVFFTIAISEKLGLFSVWPCRWFLRGETEFFTRALPEKLGLFSVWPCRWFLRGETEFFTRALPEKLGLK
jgi:hypothetical protein